MSVAIDRFNVRVYFLIVDKDKGLLVSDEVIYGDRYTKFPGGGMEYGESTVECAMREAREELYQEIEILSHFYTTDFFIRSQFKDSDQILAIYYTAKLKETQHFKTSDKRFDFISADYIPESFRWVKWENLDVNDFAFPSDKVVVKLLKEKQY